MNVDEIEKRLFIFDTLDAFLKKDKKHELTEKYYERIDGTDKDKGSITAFFLDGYGLANMFTKHGTDEELDDIEKKLKERGYDKGTFGGRHFIQTYKSEKKKLTAPL